MSTVMDIISSATHYRLILIPFPCSQLSLHIAPFLSSLSRHVYYNNDDNNNNDDDDMMMMMMIIIIIIIIIEIKIVIALEGANRESLYTLLTAIPLRKPYRLAGR